MFYPVVYFFNILITLKYKKQTCKLIVLVVKKAQKIKMLKLLKQKMARCK